MYKLTQVVYFPCTLALMSFVLQYAGIIQFHKGHTTGRGAYNVVVSLEQVLESTGQFRGFAFKARIGHRLAATSLVERIIDIHPQAFQQLVGCHPHLRIDGIDITWDKQTYFHGFIGL